MDITWYISKLVKIDKENQELRSKSKDLWQHLARQKHNLRSIIPKLGALLATSQEQAK